MFGRRSRSQRDRAKRSGDAAEHSAAAAQVSADAAAAEDRRARTPNLVVFVEELVPHDGTDVIYRVRNDGPEDLDSVTVLRSVLGPVEANIRHEVAATSRSGYGDEAEIGPIPVAQYARFTLSLGSREICLSSGSRSSAGLATRLGLLTSR